MHPKSDPTVDQASGDEQQPKRGLSAGRPACAHQSGSARTARGRCLSPQDCEAPKNCDLNLGACVRSLKGPGVLQEATRNLT